MDYGLFWTIIAQVFLVLLLGIPASLIVKFWTIWWTPRPRADHQVIFRGASDE